MKEQFRSKKFRDAIKVKLKPTRSPEGGWVEVPLSKLVKQIGEHRYWIGNAKQLLSEGANILNRYAKKGIKMTLRQFYYQLVGKDLIPNHLSVYKRIGDLVSDARYGGLIDWDAIVDSGREPNMASEWENLKELVESAIYAFRLPRWNQQDNYIEVFSEKDASTTVLTPICRKWHVHYNMNRGYSSSTAMYELSKRLQRQLQDGKEVVLIYVGDHDPSGRDMVRDVRDRLQEFVEDGDSGNHFDFSDVKIEHVALTLQQIDEYNCPPNPAKLSDSRADKYIQEFGTDSWELDALPMEVLQQLVEDKILEYIDLDQYNEWIAKEKEQVKALKEFAEQIDEGDD